MAPALHQIRPVDTRGLNPDQDFMGPWLRQWRGGGYQHIGAARLRHRNNTHFCRQGHGHLLIISPR